MVHDPDWKWYHETGIRICFIFLFVCRDRNFMIFLQKRDETWLNCDISQVKWCKTWFFPKNIEFLLPNFWKVNQKIKKNIAKYFWNFVDNFTFKVLLFFKIYFTRLLIVYDLNIWASAQKRHLSCLGKINYIYCTQKQGKKITVNLSNALLRERITLVSITYNSGDFEEDFGWIL